MLLDLCGPVSAGQGTVSAPLRHDAVCLPDDAGGEVDYPAYLIAEAFAQIACRAAQKVVPLEGRRYLPASIRGLEIIDAPAEDCTGARLIADLVRSRPLPEFTCSLVGPDENVLVRTTVVVAPAPLQPQQPAEGRP